MNEANMTTTPLAYCCKLFEEKLQSRGHGGLAIIPRRSQQIGLYFVIEFRAVAEEQNAVPLNTGDVKIYLRSEQAIRFCPWCGKNLKQFYDKQQDRLTVVEPQHELGDA